jgi:hypothetical protein
MYSKISLKKLIDVAHPFGGGACYACAKQKGPS